MLQVHHTYFWSRWIKVLFNGLMLVHATEASEIETCSHLEIKFHSAKGLHHQNQIQSLTQSEPLLVKLSHTAFSEGHVSSAGESNQASYP